MAKAKYLVKKGPQMANYLFIFVRNLKWMASHEYCPKNPVFFGWLPSYIHSSGKIFRKNNNLFENLEQATKHRTPQVRTTTYDVAKTVP